MNNEINKPQFDIHDSANRLHSNTQSEIYLDPPNMGAEVNMTFGNEYDEMIENEETEDIINKPLHYHQGGIDVIGFAKKQFSREEQRGFFRINLLKYVVRFDKKGTPIADLDKAQVYLNELKALEDDSHEN